MKMLVRTNRLYHRVNGKKVSGPNPHLWGDCTGLRGDLDDCGITPKMRAVGINIDSLVL